MATMAVAEHCDGLFLKRRGESILEFLVFPKKKMWVLPGRPHFTSVRGAAGEFRPAGYFAKPTHPSGFLSTLV
ncbi:hypothetical protein TorRG33x02_050530 [Trema orientale]|uniref:Uncharacterized protein n=1 Tax=Trema orientale TaxID=63057 RepID=A0A2P5FN69_TREOI|nr:hypothetical protein TorRG33x02_050530 [Trema orientale]